jgi:oligoendopeptidase F
LEKIKRYFLPEDYTVTTWETLQPYFEKLLATEIDSNEQFNSWLRDLSEMDAVIGEDAAWRHIQMTCDTTNKAYEDAFVDFHINIEPNIKPYLFEINKKLAASPFVENLDPHKFFPYIRSVKNAIALYRAENVPLQADVHILAQQYGALSGAMTVEMAGKTVTLQQAARHLHDPNRAVREAAFSKIATRRLQDEDKLNDLFDKLVGLRQQIAANAGFDNYRDYKFMELGRFDYTPQDCFQFHEAVREHIMPLQALLQRHRMQRLQLSELKPWDTQAEPVDVLPLHPFDGGAELAGKGIEVFRQLSPFFADCLTTMQSMHCLDLDSRVGKAPGGYNCPLPESGVPFIFMNAAGTINDVITMMHEGGHAIHSFLCHELELSAFKEYPMEMAELASMSMELFSMEHWDVFFPDTEQLKRARLEELERVIDVLPWIATIDKFQHWLYTHQGHTPQQRTDAWLTILNEFSTGVVNWDGLEHYRSAMWQKQLHLFEVPFYYIEYGIAQLGAIAMWRQYRQSKEQALANYQHALALGYTKPLNELYAAAGIRFDFSPAYIQELSLFLKDILTETGISEIAAN